MTIKHLILDVDGVFTDGKFVYSSEGKVLKTFGDADSDALNLLSPFISIEMVTGDKRGFAISEKRIGIDMDYPISLVSTHNRLEWIKERYDPKEVVYMGDGLFDPRVFIGVGYSIAPSNAFINTKSYADFVTKSKGGEGAVAEAVIHIFENLLNIEFDILSIEIPPNRGAWPNR